jgi:hypothetical protein
MLSLPQPFGEACDVDRHVPYGVLEMFTAAPIPSRIPDIEDMSTFIVLEKSSKSYIYLSIENYWDYSCICYIRWKECFRAESAEDLLSKVAQKRRLDCLQLQFLREFSFRKCKERCIPRVNNKVIELPS